MATETAIIPTGDKAGHYNPQVALMWDGTPVPVRSISPSGSSQKTRAHVIHLYNKGWIHGPHELSLNVQVWAYDLDMPAGSSYDFAVEFWRAFLKNAEIELAMIIEEDSSNGQMDAEVSNGTFAFAEMLYEKCVIENITLAGIEPGQGPVLNLTVGVLNMKITPRGATSPIA